MKLLVLFVLFGFSGNALAEKVPTPEKLEGVTIVTAKEAKKLQDGGALIVDARKKIQAVKERVKGALILSYKEKSAKKVAYDSSKDKFKIEKLGTDKLKKVIFYCNGPTCWRSYKAADAAAKAGFKHVYWLKNGFPSWKQAGLPVESN